MKENIEDSEILHLCRNEASKNHGFNILVKKYQEKLYWHVRKLVIDHDDADDVLQNTFIKVWHAMDSFREDSKLFTWIYRIATNEALGHLNKKKRHSLLSFNDVENSLSNKLESDNYFSGDEIQLKLQKAILELPEKQRIVFNMKYFDEMKYEDMAEILETSVGALKASYHHAVKKIEKYLTAD